MNKKQSKIETKVDVARDEFQVTKDFPLIITLDTPTGHATVVAHYNSSEVFTSDYDTKKLLESEVSIKLKGNKRYVSVPWVANVETGYYLDDKAGIIPVKDRLADNILLKGVHRLTDSSDIIHVPVTAWKNSNYIVIGSHHGLTKTDWSKYKVIPVMSSTGVTVFIVNPTSEEIMPFISYKNISAPFRGYELTDEVKSSEPSLVNHTIGITKQMKKARGVIVMKKWNDGRVVREALLYQTPNHIFIHIDGVEYKAEKVPADLVDLDDDLEMYNIHTHKLIACIGVIKGKRKARAIVSVKVRYVDTGLTWYEKVLIKLGHVLSKNRKDTVGDFMNIDFIEKPTSLASLSYDAKAELIERSKTARDSAHNFISN